jgi:peptidyl-prolyl cis-trans isomerase SurA
MWTKGFIILTFVFFQLSAFGQQPLLAEKVVAQVGEEIILLSEVEERYVLQSGKMGVVPDDFKCSILKDLMIEKLLVDQARIDSVEVSDAQVDSRIDLKMNDILQQMNNDEDFFEQYYGKTVREMKASVFEETKNQLLAQQVNYTLTDGIKVTPSEVVDLFEAIPKDSLPIFNAEVEYRELVYAPKVNEVERGAALSQ